VEPALTSQALAGLGAIPGGLPLRHARARALGLDPPASCRLSFYVYNATAEIDQAVAAVAAIAGGRRAFAVPSYRDRSGQPEVPAACWPEPAGSA
jgi:hypothetical protein